MRKLVAVRTIDGLTKVYDEEVLDIDNAEVDDHPSPRVLFHAGGTRVLSSVSCEDAGSVYPMRDRRGD